MTFNRLTQQPESDLDLRSDRISCAFAITNVKLLDILFSSVSDLVAFNLVHLDP